jgi:hypothetical protein
MELKEFISTTLTEIVEGIKKAQEVTKGSGAVISPWIKAEKDAHRLADGAGRHVTPIEFQVALTKSEESEGKTGIGVFFSVVGIGAHAKTDAQQESANSVKFTIPVALPIGDAEKIIISDQ